MSFLDNDVFDDGLQSLTDNGEVLYICDTEPTSYVEANSTYKLGTKSSPTISAPADRVAGGREVTISAITDGVVDASGTAGWLAICDISNTKLLAVQALGATHAVVAGNPFSLTEFNIGIPDPA